MSARTATEIAQRAVEIARTLSPTMGRALKYAWTDRDGVLRLDNGAARMRTRDALRRRQLVDGFALTTMGRFVRAVLLTSEAEVLAWAARQDTPTTPTTTHPPSRVRINLNGGAR